MKAVIYDKKSAFERLTYTDVPKPSPKDNELLIEIHAVSINALILMKPLMLFVILMKSMHMEKY